MQQPVVVKNYHRRKREDQPDASILSLSRDKSTADSPRQRTPVKSLPVGETQANSPFRTIFSILKDWLRRHFYFTGEHPLTFPSPPSDQEKTLYIGTHRHIMIGVGVLALCVGSYGAWVCISPGNPFYWLCVFFSVIHYINAALIQLVAIFGEDFDYEKHQKIVQDHSITENNAPMIDVYLPCCREPLDILKNTYKYVQALEYPKGCLEIHVLDDGGSPEVEDLATQYGFNYMTRDDKPYLKKAGSLRWAFRRTRGEFFVIFDADVCPRSDFLYELVPRILVDPTIGIVQSSEYFRTLDSQTWVERGGGAFREQFDRYIQPSRHRWGGAMCVGSNAVYRRAALRETDGVVECSQSEDLYTGIYVVNKGWKLLYVPLCLACGNCPDSPRSFFSQQVRWCQGSFDLVMTQAFWKSKLTAAQKASYAVGSFSYYALALTTFSFPIPGIMVVWYKVNLVPSINIVLLPGFLRCFVFDFLWNRGNQFGMCILFVGIIQQYAFLVALNNSILGTSLDWIPTGQRVTHQSSRYRNMHLLCCLWVPTYFSLFITGCIHQVRLGYPWYKLSTLFLYYVYMVFQSLPFMLAW